MWRCSAQEQDVNWSRSEGIPEGTGKELPTHQTAAHSTHFLNNSHKYHQKKTQKVRIFSFVASLLESNLSRFQNRIYKFVQA